MAMGQEEVEQVQDTLVPDDQGMMEYKEITDDFIREVWGDGNVPDEWGDGGKRKTPFGETGGTKKRNVADTIDTSNCKEACQNGTIKKWTVKLLKDHCSQIGISDVGKKQDLIDAIMNYYGLMNDD